MLLCSAHCVIITFSLTITSTYKLWTLNIYIYTKIMHINSWINRNWNLHHQSLFISPTFLEYAHANRWNFAHQIAILMTIVWLVLVLACHHPIFSHLLLHVDATSIPFRSLGPFTNLVQQISFSTLLYYIIKHFLPTYHIGNSVNFLYLYSVQLLDISYKIIIQIAKLLCTILIPAEHLHHNLL